MTSNTPAKAKVVFLIRSLSLVQGTYIIQPNNSLSTPAPGPTCVTQTRDSERLNNHPEATQPPLGIWMSPNDVVPPFLTWATKLLLYKLEGLDLQFAKEMGGGTPFIGQVHTVKERQVFWVEGRHAQPCRL